MKIWVRDAAWAFAVIVFSLAISALRHVKMSKKVIFELVVANAVPFPGIIARIAPVSENIARIARNAKSLAKPNHCSGFRKRSDCNKQTLKVNYCNYWV